MYKATPVLITAAHISCIDLHPLSSFSTSTFLFKLAPA
jgi:hypothetical protein